MYFSSKFCWNQLPALWNHPLIRTKTVGPDVILRAIKRGPLYSYSIECFPYLIGWYSFLHNSCCKAELIEKIFNYLVIIWSKYRSFILQIMIFFVCVWFSIGPESESPNLFPLAISIPTSIPNTDSDRFRLRITATSNKTFPLVDFSW